MANSKHVAVLLRSIEEWNAWRERSRGESPDLQKANLAGIRLTGADLTDANLNDANLIEADLRGANLRGAELRRADLSRADLTEVNLRRATLSAATLYRTNLSNADLFRANVSGANLGHAHLSGAHLTDANLRDGDVRHADLYGASLRHADLTRAKLGGANLSQTVWGSTRLCSVDLSAAIGLDRCRHDGPSSIDHETMRRSATMPVEFLRGCGLLDWEMEAIKLYNNRLKPSELAEITTRIHELRVGAPIKVKPIFISYSRVDEGFVNRLSKALDEKKVRYWHDRKDATSGRLDEVIEHGLALHPTALVVLSRSSITRPWVEFEINAAVQRGSKLCPIAIDDTWRTSTSLSGHLRTQLTKYVVLDFSDTDRFDARFRQLWTGIERYYSG